AFLLEQTQVDVVFSRFDRQTRCYREVSASVVRSLLSSSAVQSPAVGGEHAAELDGPPAVAERRLRGVARSAVRRAIGALPDGSRNDATLVVQSAIGVAKGLYWLSLRFARAVLRRPPRAREAPIQVEVKAPSHADALSLGPEDVYVSMGLDWEYND